MAALDNTMKAKDGVEEDTVAKVAALAGKYGPGQGGKGVGEKFPGRIS